MAELPREPLLREVEQDLLRAVDELDRLAGAFPAEAGDLASRADEAAQGGHLTDDARVVGGIGRRGHEGGQLVDAVAAADVLELAPLLELVDERDRVDGLTLRVQADRSAVDLRVALAVEVGRIEDFADRSDRARGEHHGPEDGFLGLEVLGWRDRGGFCELGDRGHSRGVKHPLCGAATSGRCGFRHVESDDLQGESGPVWQARRTELWMVRPLGAGTSGGVPHGVKNRVEHFPHAVHRNRR